MIRLYLDNCCYNRPFDDQSQIKIQLESEAKLELQKMIKNSELELVWSFILDFENQQNFDTNKRNEIFSFEKYAKTYFIGTSKTTSITHQIINIVGTKKKGFCSSGLRP